MTDKENKAIEWIKVQKGIHYKTIIDLIEKQDKIINEMAKYIANIDITEMMCPRCRYRNKECTLEECIEEITKYFKKKVDDK